MKARISIGALLVLAVVGVFLLASSVSYTSVQEALLSYVWKSDTELAAEAWMVVDVTNDRVILESNADEVLPIASITKLFTAHAGNISGQIDTSAVVTNADIFTEGNSGSLEAGQEYTLRELLFPMLLVSSNDASEVLLRNIGRGVFASLFEQISSGANLTKTYIADASGLDHKNVSTARELVQFISYLKEQDPYILDITRLRYHTGQHGSWQNNNPAIDLDGFVGGKHGFTPEAGRTFAGIFNIEGYYKSAEFVVVVLGSTDLDADLGKIHTLIKRKVW